MTGLLVLRWVHLVAAATWLGGLIVLGPLVVALRRAGVERDGLRAAARMFSYVTWTAMAVAVATGLLNVHLLGLPWTYGRLHLKLALVGLTIAVAGFHQVTAARTSARARGAIQGVLLIASLAVFGAAVAL